LAVQMQATRVFWLLDFTMAAYIAWWLGDDRRRLRAAALTLLAAASIGRGVFLLSQDRRLFAVSLPDSPWVQALLWLRAQPPSWYVLADPTHAWKYGLSARLVAEKDTFAEIGKDTALAMYDRRIAMSVQDHLAAAANFEGLTTAEARALAATYGVNVLIIDARHRLDLAELYRNKEFVVYKLS
jgi:hypothetical protein